MNLLSKIRRPLLYVGASLLFTGAMATASSVRAAPQQTAPDNTRANKGDAQSGAVTADQQKINPADRAITKKIRTALMQDKSLSTYAQNVKIITQDGKVTLKGPVRTEKEKADVEAKASAIAGDANVTSEIKVAPKS